jgi:hypothetical protein
VCVECKMLSFGGCCALHWSVVCALIADEELRREKVCEGSMVKERKECVKRGKLEGLVFLFPLRLF